MKKFICTIFFVFSVGVIGQTGSSPNPINYNIDMYPKTPDVAALSKFVDIPAGNFTGVANFTIPLYNIKVDGLNIPINLNYSTSGIKVEEISSRVGLGWAINTGPFLAQQVLGIRDKSSKRPISQSQDPTITGSCPYDTGYTYSSSNPSNCGVALSAVGLEPFDYEFNIDSQPDIFSYNLINDDGHFILDSNGEKAIPRPFNLIKITPKRSYGSLNGFEITDQKGIIYNFKESSPVTNIRNLSSCYPFNEDDRIPDFKLDSITTINNKKIYYNYSKSISASYITSIKYDEFVDRQNVGTIKPEYLPALKCVNKTVALDKILANIIFDGGKVLFYYNNDPEGFTESVRQDLIGDVYLTRVKVIDNNNNTVKDISLIYDYFVSNDSVPELYENYLINSPEIFRRLKLKKVKDNLSTNEYNLLYNGDEEGLSLPNRMSFSQDYWGIYNGKINSSPIASLKTNTFKSPKVRVYMGGNKLPDFNFGFIGNLKKIMYPTGGYTQISYEADDYNNEIYNPEMYDYKQHESEETNLNMAFIEFEIPNDGKPIYNQGIIMEDSNCSKDSQDQSTNSTPMWELYKKNSSGTYSKRGDGFVCTKTQDRDEGPGIYRLKVYERAIDGAPIPPSGNRIITAKYSWVNEEIYNTSSVNKIGTMRVKKIESNSSDNGKIVRKFEYKNPITNLSSGKNQGQELFLPLVTEEINVGRTFGVGDGRSMKYIVRTNSPSWQTHTIKGKSVGYEYVQEIYESSLDPIVSYKKQFKFNLGYSDPAYEYNHLSVVNITYPQKILDAGLLLEEKLYNKNGDTIRHIKNEYEYDPYFNQFASMNLVQPPYNALDESVGRAIIVKTKRIDTDGLGGQYYHFNINYITLKNIWIKNVNTTTTDYVNNLPSLVTKQTTEYSINSGQNRHTYPKSQTTSVLGSGVTLSESYKYAHDISNYLKDKNMISIPLETEVKKNGITISKTETHYPVSQTEANTKTSGLPLPFEVLSKNLQNLSMEKQIKYDFYDNKGNLLQYTLKPDSIDNGGIQTAIIWGYKQTHPIAKIEGATYAQVTTFATAIIAASNSDVFQPANNDETSLLTTLDTFRESFPNFQVTTYTYDPLIGVRSITPPSGIREYYIYDTANRLKFVKDVNGKILKEYQYNYKP